MRLHPQVGLSAQLPPFLAHAIIWSRGRPSIDWMHDQFPPLPQACSLHERFTREARRLGVFAPDEAMKLLLLSDLHIEFAGFSPPPGGLDDVDAVILAGDVMPNVRKLPSWLSRAAVFGPDLPLICILGNHEFYGGRLDSRRAELAAAAEAFPNVHVLDPGEVLLDGGRVRVLGCVLWTDFKLPIQTPDGLVADRDRATGAAQRGMNDYAAIHVDDAESRNGRRLLRPEDTLAMHQADRAWLLAKLEQPFAGETVVVTHHGPAAGSVAPRWADNWLSPAFSSDLPDKFFRVPKLWVHGHTHDSRDYVRGDTRVVCNPRGYRMRDGSFENDEFNPRLVIEI